MGASLTSLQIRVLVSLYSVKAKQSGIKVWMGNLNGPRSYDLVHSQLKITQMASLVKILDTPARLVPTVICHSQG